MQRFSFSKLRRFFEIVVITRTELMLLLPLQQFWYHELHRRLPILQMFFEKSQQLSIVML